MDRRRRRSGEDQGRDEPDTTAYLQQLGYGMLDIGMCAPIDSDDAASARALSGALRLELVERGLSQADLIRLRARGYAVEPGAHGLHLVVQQPPAA